VKKVEGPQGGKPSKIIEHLTSSSEEVYLGRLSKEELRRTGFEALWEPSEIWWEKVYQSETGSRIEWKPLLLGGRSSC